MYFYENFVRLCAENKKSPSSVAEAVGFHRSDVTGWKKGREPREASVQRLALYLGVNKEEFYRDPKEIIKKPSTKTEPDSSELDELLEDLRRRPETRALLAASRGMTKEQVERMTHFISSIREDS